MKVNRGWIDADIIDEVIDDDGYFCAGRIADLLAEVKRLREIIGVFDEFMCNNWTPANVHSLWNELLTKEDEEE